MPIEDDVAALQRDVATALAQSTASGVAAADVAGRLDAVTVGLGVLAERVDNLATHPALVIVPVPADDPPADDPPADDPPADDPPADDPPADDPPAPSPKKDRPPKAQHWLTRPMGKRR